MRNIEITINRHNESTENPIIRTRVGPLTALTVLDRDALGAETSPAT